MNTQETSRSVWGHMLAVAGLSSALGIQVATMLIAAGYHAAFGGADAAGHVLGFNQPLMAGHLQLMEESLSAPAVLQELNIFTGTLLLVTLAALLRAVGPWSKQPERRLFTRHSLLFTASWIVFMGYHLVSVHRWTGECIDEGELSFVMVGLLWIAAWIPALGWELAGLFKPLPTLNSLPQAKP